MRILVTGASGFAGSQLIPGLLRDGHTVRALARDPARIDLDLDLTAAPGERMEALCGDILTGAGLDRAMDGAEVAYYLIHSMERPPTHSMERPPHSIEHRPPHEGESAPFPERERAAAENFAAAAVRAGVGRIVYLGGPTASWTRNEAGMDENALSPHLRSREAVEGILRGAVPGTVALRASIVIGARSKSFRFMVRLVERMPVLALGAWRSYRTRPIDARDVIDMLVAAGTFPAETVAGATLDVGGPDVLSYGEMIRRIAELMMLSRPTVGLSVSGTPLTARVAAAVAGEDPELVGALMESLRGDLLPGGPYGKAHLRGAELLGVRLHSFDAAVERSLREWEAVEPLAAR